MLYQTSCIWNDRKEKRQAEQYFGKKLLQYALFSEGRVVGEPVIEIGTHGKPYLKDYPQIAYNLTHTDKTVYLYLERNQRDDACCSVGIDAEPIREIRESLVKKTLSKEEQEAYAACEKERRAELFFRFWTLKESFLKAVGVGITVPLPSVSFRLDKEEIVCAQNLSDLDWKFTQFQENQTIVSVCSNQPLHGVSHQERIQCQFRYGYL